MNNFEKFKNKEISGTESSKVMGGTEYSFCENQPFSSCIFWEYLLSVNFCQYEPDPEQCLNEACDMAIFICEMQ